MDIGDVCRMYRYVKVLNKKVYQTGQLVSRMENIIQQQLPEMEERDMVTLLNFRSGYNIFAPVILGMIFDSFDKNGQTPISAQTVFKLLIRMSDY